MNTVLTIVASVGGICLLSLLLASFVSLWNHLNRQHGPRFAIVWAALLLSPPIPLFGMLLTTCLLHLRRGPGHIERFIDWWTGGDGTRRHEPLSWHERSFASNLVLLLVCGVVLLAQSVSGWWVVSHTSIVSMITVPWVVAGVLASRLLWQAVGRYA